MQRRVITISGVVQGVGFRPFVYALARRCELTGWVRNQGGSVVVAAEGETDRLDRFLRSLNDDAPPLSRIERIDWIVEPVRHEVDFRVIASDAKATHDVRVCPDVATCDDCLRELYDPADRRYLYPFLNCTNCGPRLTILRKAPYDRDNTSMAEFPMCAACRAEYEDPANRRFHAQATACPACGPLLRLADRHGQTRDTADPIADAIAIIKAGGIVAVKGLGGYHLACDATSDGAVHELRTRKRRDDKPFAVMVANLEQARHLCEIDDAEGELMSSPRRPIVLVRKRPDHGVAEATAPGSPTLGLMLPSTPLHHLVMRRAGRPLVMTSGNRSDEPIATGDDDALSRLADIADAFLTHDREIVVRCDDSVIRVVAGQELPIRRSRGDAPAPVALPVSCPSPMLAVGGQLKGTFALGRGRQAIVSHHLGDLDHLEAFRAFEKDVRLYEELFGVRPEVVVHDQHPDYASTWYAQGLGIPSVAVGHHHAHIASCLVEHGLDRLVIGVAFDGAGFGPDGTIWGGEFLLADLRDARRVGHLRPVPMPGAEQAVRQPWRMALSHLVDAGLPTDLLEGRVDPAQIQGCRRLLERQFNAPLTSSMGRLFDAVASLIGLRDAIRHEGQAAMELEWRADGETSDRTYPFDVAGGDVWVVDSRPLIAAVVDDVRRRESIATIAARFHGTIARMTADVCRRIRETTGIGDVVLSGGVFLNARLTTLTEARLREAGFVVYRHRIVPPGDGGLCLGQLAIAAATTDAASP